LGASDWFTLLSVNVATYLGATRHKLASLIRAQNVDIVCTQEDVLHHEMDGIGDVVASCGTGEEIEDATETSTMANVIYSNHRTLRVASLDLQGECPVGRCAVMAEFLNRHPIVNVHLCGGRYDDRNFRQLGRVKEDQLRKVVEAWDPSIIVGDFNVDPEVRPSLETHPVFRKLVTDAERQEYIAYHTNGHAYLESMGFVRALQDISTATSRYGGQPDHIYYRPDRGLSILRVEVVPFQPSTDHNALRILFRAQPSLSSIA
jgi:endonuclease/exonuclease/phosphatase family metal-dependent hydrolase